LAQFLDGRGICWFENFQSEFAADCFSASIDLDPRDFDVERRWAMATFLHPIIEQVRPQIDDVSQPLTVRFPRPRNKMEHRRHRLAKEWFDRIIKNRRTKKHDALQQFIHTETVTVM
jgi:hypothetical protein